jgi:hypothetical protein
VEEMELEPDELSLEHHLYQLSYNEIYGSMVLPRIREALILIRIQKTK